jgi:endonuclease/exonuclease/phosphatase (EEP) superfamily protein YafD
MVFSGAMLERSGAGRCWLIWAAVLPVAAWALVRAFGLERDGMSALLMLFTPWAALAGLFLAGLSLALRNWAAALLAALATAYLAAAVLPRAIGTETVSAEGRETVSVVASNVYLGQADPRALVELVDRYHAEILTVEELTPTFAAGLQREGILDRLPYAFLMANSGGVGGGVYSSLRMRPLREQTSFVFRMPRVALTTPSGQRLRVVAVHPNPPNAGYRTWKEALRSLPAGGAGPPWILAGDFNSTFDDAEFRDVVDRGYRDAGAATGQGLEPTWPSSLKLPFGLTTIDHVLADERLGIADYGVDYLPGSDHRTIHAEIVLPER